MPRYFLHLRCPEIVVPDAKGVNLRDADEAYEIAKSTARELMQENTDAAVTWLSCLFEVNDSAGEVVLELPFTEAVEVPPGAH